MVRVKARRTWVALLASMFALVLALAGCAQGGGDASKNFIGDWKLVGMEEGGEVTSSEDIALMEQLGMSVTMSVKEDKTLTLSVLGEEMSGTWEATSGTEATATIDGQKASMKIANDVLVLEQDGAKMSFEKGVPEPSTSGAAATDDGTDSAAAIEGAGSDESAIPIGQTIADDELCTIEVVDKRADWAGDPGYTLKITNKSDKTMVATAEYGSFSVNGKMLDPALYETIQPGKYVECFMWFEADEVGGVEALANVEGAIEIYDDATYDTLGTYPFAQ